MLKEQALSLLHRARIAGGLTVAVLLLMGIFAGVAHASSVTSVSVTNSAPTDAAGARTVYSISFDTSSAGGLSTAANSSITITFPSGTGLTNVNSSEILTANNQNIGDCSVNQANLTATCFVNETVAAGASLNVQLGGVANPPPPAPGSLQSLTVKTSSDTTAVGASFPIVANNPITKLSVTNSSPTDATGGRTVYSITFDTSSTGGMSTLANSAITITFPSGTGLTNVNSSQILASNQNIGDCSVNQANLTATCAFFSNETVGAGSPLTIQLGGVANPPVNPTGAPTQSLTVQTTSDPTAVAASFPVVTNNPITKLSVTNSSPTDAAGARTVYSIEFDTSTTGGMSTLANSAITITFPSGTGLTNVNSSQILAGNQNIGDCSVNQNALTATCGFFSNETVGAGSPLTIQLGGVANPPVNPTGGQTQSLMVNTTSDTTPVSASFPVVTNNPVTNVSVTNSSPTDAAGGRTVYSISFDTSSTGGLSTLANSAITITFPSGTGLTNVNSSQILTASSQNIGDCSVNQNALTATCQFFSNETVASGSPLTIQLGGVANPPVNPNGGKTQSLTVQTTSDTSSVSASFPVAANNRISQPVVSLSNTALGASGVT